MRERSEMQRGDVEFRFNRMMRNLGAAGTCWLAATVLVPLLIGCSFYIGRGDLSEAEQHFNQGNELLLEGQLQEAIRQFDEAIRLDSGLAEAYFGRGSAYGQLGQSGKALADLDEAIRLKPKESMFYNNRGRVYDSMGDPDLASADYETALKLDPDNHLAHLNQGTIYANYKQEFEKALASYERVIELEPDYAQAYVNRAQVRFVLERFDSAIADIDKAIELGVEPELDGLIHNERGRAYLAVEDNQRALADFEKALELDPSLDHVYANRGLAHARLGNTKQAIEDLEHFISTDPDPALRAEIEPLLRELRAQ